MCNLRSNSHSIIYIFGPRTREPESKSKSIQSWRDVIMHSRPQTLMDLQGVMRWKRPVYAILKLV